MNGGHVTETISLWESFLSRDAMRKRGLCRHAVCVCLFVRPSVTIVYSHSVERSKYVVFPKLTKSFFIIG